MDNEEIGNSLSSMRGEDPSDQFEESTEEPSAPEGSILKTLKEKRKEISSEKTLKKDIPGYGGFLVAEYKILPYEEVSKLVSKAQKAKNPRHELAAQTDVLVRACVEIYVRPDTDDEESLQPLKEADSSFGEDPVRFDPRLAVAAGVSGETSRQIAQALFNNDLALVSHSNEVINWMRDTEREGDTGF